MKSEAANESVENNNKDKKIKMKMAFFVKSMFVHLIQNVLTTVGIHHVA